MASIEASLWEICYVGSLANVIPALTACTFFLLAVTLLVHRVAWPVIQRPMYAFQGFGVARRSKLFGSLGFLLVGGGALGATPLQVLKILLAG